MARWRRNLLITLAVLAGFIAVPGVPWLYFDRRYSRELQRELDALRAQGAPLSLAEVAPKAVPDEQNAGLVYLKVFGLRPDGLDWDRPPEALPPTVLERADLSEAWSRGADRETALARGRQALRDPAVRRALADLLRAAHRPYCLLPTTLPPRAWSPIYPRFRLATRVVCLHANVSAADGNLAEACAWLATGYGMAWHLCQQRRGIAQLVSYAMLAMTDRAAKQVLTDAPLDPATARPLQQALAVYRLNEAFAEGMLGDRVVSLEMWADVRRHPARYADEFGGWRLKLWLHEWLVRLGHSTEENWAPLDPWQPLVGQRELWVAAVRSHLLDPVLMRDELTYLRHWNVTVRESRLAYRELARRAQPSRPPRPPLLMVPGLVKDILPHLAAKRDYAQAQADLAQQVLDLKLYRRAHGQYPASLAAPGVKARPDVFSGQSLRYRPQGNGFVLYSLGQNLRDDGGLADHRPDEGDIVWQCTR